MIQFQFDPEKFANAVAFFVKRKPALTKKQLCKLMYFADKQHLLCYGYPITGDSYCALEQGHVPSRGLNAINGDVRRAGKVAVDSVRQFGHLAADRREFVLDHDPDMKIFSRSEVAVLENVISELGDKSAWQLERKSHNEPSWKKTPQNMPCDFELFFEGHPEADIVRQVVVEEYSAPQQY